MEMTAAKMLRQVNEWCVLTHFSDTVFTLIVYIVLPSLLGRVTVCGSCGYSTTTYMQEKEKHVRFRPVKVAGSFESKGGSTSRPEPGGNHLI